MDATTLRTAVIKEIRLSASEAIDVELWCAQVAVSKIAPAGTGLISMEEKDEAIGKCRSRALEILREYREKGIPLSDLGAVLQTADWGN